MKREAILSLTIAALALAFLQPKDVQSMQTSDSPASQDAASPMGQSEAMQMVQAEAILEKTIDSRKAQAGQEFKAKLGDNVQLKNGPELPRGTELIGTVSTDDMQTSGTSRLALRFTQAQLKDGKTIPIKATIVNLYSTDSAQSLDPNFWTPDELQIDQEGALSGVELHSKIADNNSGVLVSTKKGDVKLPQGYGIALAISALPVGAQTGNGSNGGA
jgi:hypothetical protein